MIQEERPVARMREILGTEGLVLLCQELGGTRLYLPNKLPDEHDIVKILGRDLAAQLCRELAPAWLRVPLARRERALYWRGKGYSNARIATKLGMTETGIDKLFDREADLPPKPISGRSPRQLSLL